MDSQTLKPNVQDLQSDVIELLEQVSLLMNRASTALNSDVGSEKYIDFEQRVKQEIAKVKNLELRMAIVAPMKAGKSTITNAIIGQDILPSRNSAMTTLPTEIIFDTELEEPILNLSPEIVTVFQETLLALWKQINEMGLKQSQEKLAQYPHLQEMLKSIQKDLVESIPHTSKGHNDIILTLTSLNDIVRLCSILYPSVDPLQSLTEVPRVRTPFWLSQGNQQSETLGKLVIVDTPEANEAGENLRLQTVVAEQLRKSSMVLIVLDFTQLKNEAAEKVKKDVQKVIELRGKENLYVLINKVDQRRDGDMKPEQVQKFVAAEFGIGDIGDINRVFEISARRAFTSANFLMELQQIPDVEVSEMKTARSLAQEVFGMDWEEDLKEATVVDLKNKAQRLWKKSGFDPFLKGAINTLMEQAAPRCIDSALKITNGYLVILKNDVKIRCSAVNQDSSKIQNEIKSLNDDLSDLEWCLKDLEEQLDSTKKSLREKLDLTLKRLNIDTERAIQDYFFNGIIQRILQSKNFLQTAADILDINTRKFLFQPIDIPGLTEILPESISRLVKYQVGLFGRNELEFKIKKEAEEFSEQLVAEAKQIVEALLYKSLKEIEIEIKNSQHHLRALLQKETKVVIENASNRLNRAFDIELELPPLLLEDMETNFSNFINITEKEEPFNIVKTVANFFKRLFDSEYTEKKENRYTVSIEAILIQFNSSIKIKIQDAKEQINQYLDKDFQNRISNFFNLLQDYLTNYKNSLSQALQDQSLSLEDRDKIIQNLTYLDTKSDEIIKKVRQKQAFIYKLIQDK